MSRRASRPSSALVGWSVVLVGGLALAAALAPLVYAGLLAVFPELRWPLARVFNRVAMVMAVVLLVLFRRSVGWEELTAMVRGRSLGVRARDTVAGFLCALGAAAVGLAWAWVNGEIGPPAAPPPRLAARTASFVVGGLVAGTLEEAFFRGMMLQRLTRELGWRTAALASSAVYALIHLLVSDPTVRWNGYSPEVGFEYLAHAVGRQAEPAAVPVLVGLFVLGLVFAAVVRRTGSLELAIGRHAGWVLSLQLVSHAARPLIEIPGAGLVAWRQFWVGRPWAWAAIALSGLVILAWAARRRRGRERERAGGAEPAS
jgi:membrane protease YdiL (CAAX protease family)